jgi:hypothetical protein
LVVGIARKFGDLGWAEDSRKKALGGETPPLRNKQGEYQYWMPAKDITYGRREN